MLQIFIDGDACPVKAEVLRVAERHGLRVHLVSNAWLAGFDHPLVTKTVVGGDLDAADHWIAEQVGEGDIVITADIALAAAAVEKKARAIDPRGKGFTADSIGMASAMRDLMSSLRQTGDVMGGPAAYGPRDRSRFLEALENGIQAIRRGR